MGYIEDEQRYGLLHHFTDGRAALDKVRELLATPALRARYAERRARLLADKINPTPWLVALGNDLLENRRNTPQFRLNGPLSRSPTSHLDMRFRSGYTRRT